MDTYILLCIALELKNTEVANLLLTSSSKDNEKSTSSNNRLLHFAILNDDTEIIQIFLDRGANAKNFNGKTALHDAVESMRRDIIDAGYRNIKNIVNLLSSRGATVDDNGNDACHIAADTGKNCPLLHLAVDKGNEEITKLFLNKGANVNAKGRHNTTALHIATEKGYPKIVELLLKHGADVNSAYTSTFQNGYTSLHLAAGKGNEEITILLLCNSANVNARGNDDTTSLHIATEKGYSQIVKYLLNAGADVNSAYTTTTRHGYTPLHLAVENQREQITRLLLSKGANVNAKGDTGATCLYIATEKQDLTIIEQLLNHGADVNSAYTSRHGYTPVHLAAEIGDEEIMKLLLSSGPNVDAKGDSGITPLHIATERRSFQIVELLLTHGADINSAYTSTIREAYTSLHLAAVKGDKEITELFLSKGANVNAKGRHDTTALHIATEKGHSKIVELLLQHGANVNSAYTSTFREGYTSLHLAAEKGDEEITKLLLRNGADVNAKEIHGTSSLHLATQWGHSSIVDHLLKRGADVHSASRKGHTPLSLAVENGHEEIVNLLLECDANVDAEYKDNKTILHFAVVTGNPTIVEHILKHRADLNNRNIRSAFNIAVQGCGIEYEEIVKYLLRYGFTVNLKDMKNFIHPAVKNGHLELVEELLKHSTDVNILFNAACRNGYKPLHVAIRYRQKEVAELLLSYGADVNAPDETGRTAIFYATEKADLEMTELLLTNKANVKDNPELLNDAVRDGHREIVEVLLQHGADVNGSDKYGRKPLHFIITDRRRMYQLRYREVPDINVKTEVAKLLLSKGADANTRMENSMTMLHAAIWKRYVKVVEALLEYNADVNSIYEDDITPLLLSAVLGNDEIMEMLLHKGANIIVKGTSAVTVLQLAVSRDDTKVVELLLKCSVKVDTTIKCDLLPLNMAAAKRYPEMVKLLLKFGANVDFTDAIDFTALHCAAREGYADIVTILLEHGADITIMNEDKYTALDFAMDGIKGSTDFDEYSYTHDDAEIAIYVNIVEILKRHMVKIKAANLPAVNKYVLSVSSDDEEKSNFLNESDEAIARVYSKKVRKEKRLARYDFQDECEKEVKNMKSEKFVDTFITVYDILTKDANQLAMYVKNKSIVEAFGSGDYNEKFPIYASMLNRNFRNGEKRKEFLERGKQIFYSFFQNIPEIPRVCSEKIFSLLSDRDIRVLIGDCRLIELCYQSNYMKTSS